MQAVGPEEFLELIYNAEIIITSSFHATVFSILFEKQFLTVPHPKTGDRVKELLSKLGLSDRILERYSDKASVLCDLPIDYTFVKVELSVLRDNSINYIKNCVQLVNSKEDRKQIS